MEVLLALLLGAVVGLVAGGVGGMYWATRMFARAVKRELDSGVIDRPIAERLADVRGL